MHRNMKVMLKSPVQRRYVSQIHTENDIENILYGWILNMNVSAKSIAVMVTDNYSYTSLGSLIFTVHLEKNLAQFICGVRNGALSDDCDRIFL